MWTSVNPLVTLSFFDLFLPSLAWRGLSDMMNPNASTYGDSPEGPYVLALPLKPPIPVSPLHVELASNAALAFSHPCLPLQITKYRFRYAQGEKGAAIFLPSAIPTKGRPRHPPLALAVFPLRDAKA